MDLVHSLPEKQEGRAGISSKFAYFGLSLQGASHLETQAPCQDFNDFRYIKELDLFIAAISDGVGSCRLSHWGAYTAVTNALNYVESELRSLGKGRKLTLDTAQNATLKSILVGAFKRARKAVEEMADAAQIAVHNFQATLTVAIYDGSNLMYGHVGDDGIVAQDADGQVEMITQRLKGEEASSVYPLQSGEEYWTFGRSQKPIVAFLMATDGVLDAFVAKASGKLNIKYFNGICYSFMEEAVYALAKKNSSAAEEALAKYKEYMQSKAYREVVVDDLTLVAVVNRESIGKSMHPQFDKAEWDRIEKKLNEERRKQLWGTPPKTVTIGNVLNGPKEGGEKSETSPNPQPEKDGNKTMRRIAIASSIALVVGLSMGIFAGRSILAPNKGENQKLKTRCEELEERCEELEEINSSKNRIIESLRRKGN